MVSTETVRARIDPVTKARATQALAAMGLSVSDAIRMLLVRIADEKRLPFDVKAPNRATQAAMDEAEAGKAKRFDDAASLMADLDAED